jgi:uncharacterized protein with HEPN domain
MKGVRNLLAHEYFGVDVGIIWQTIQEDLPAITPFGICCPQGVGVQIL